MEVGAEGLCGDLESVLTVGADARGLGVFVAYTVAWCDHRRAPEGDPLREDVEAAVSLVRSRYSLEGLRSDPVVRAYRGFYWRIGIDPTKTRPASEALVRRALRGSFPRISPVVDAGNVASVETMVPIGLYDLSRAEPPFRVVLSRGGEVFRAIGGKPEVLGKGVPILVDSRGTVMHVYPHRDSVDTMVREDTRTLLVTAAGVPGVPKELVRRAAARVAELLRKMGWRWCGRVALSE